MVAVVPLPPRARNAAASATDPVASFRRRSAPPARTRESARFVATSRDAAIRLRRDSRMPDANGVPPGFMLGLDREEDSGLAHVVRSSGALCTGSAEPARSRVDHERCSASWRAPGRFWPNSRGARVAEGDFTQVSCRCHTQAVGVSLPDGECTGPASSRAGVSHLIEPSTRESPLPEYTMTSVRPRVACGSEARAEPFGGQQQLRDCPRQSDCPRQNCAPAKAAPVS